MHKPYFIKFLILSLFINIACEGGRGSGNRDEVATSGSMVPIIIEKDLPLDATVKIYFENTLSMDGYINGNTDFKDVFRELLVAVDNEDVIDLETEFYLINDKLIKESFGVETTKIADALSKQSISKGNRGTSNFEDVLNTVLENQTGDVISIVMADFIYSPGNETDTPSALNKLKTYTKEAFLKAGIADKDIETTIYRFSSRFDGIYYNINNSHIKGINHRPYYYFVIAPSNLMTVFEKQISPQLRNNKGFENEISFSPRYFENIPYQVFSATKSNGRINTRNGIEIVDYPRQGNLEFLVALDLTGVPLHEDYFLNKDNYHLGNDQFIIKDIGTINGKKLNFKTEGKTPINPSDLLKIQGKDYTHVILVSAKGLVSEDLKLSLRKSIPTWVNNSSSNDDRAIKSDSLEQTKTFGFAYLIEGISNSYIQKTGSKEYFNVKIPVIKK
jgi:hypothetical protein